MSISFNKSIVRIYKEQNEEKIIGAGFLVSDEYLITCAHVVNESLGYGVTRQEKPNNTEIIKFDFPVIASGQPLEAIVEEWKPVNFRTNEPQDIAILRLQSKLPDDVKQLPLINTKEQDLDEHKFKAFGFPKVKPTGVNSEGKIRGDVAYQKIQIQVIGTTEYRIEGGFSGTAIWDKTLEGVVGMAVSAEKFTSVEESYYLPKGAFFIPTDMLIKAFPELQKVAIINERIPQIIKLLSQGYQESKEQVDLMYNELLSYMNLQDSLFRPPILISEANLIDIIYQLDGRSFSLTSRLNNIKWLEVFVGFLILELEELSQLEQKFKQNLTSWLRESQKDNYDVLISTLEVKLDKKTIKLDENNKNLETKKKAVEPCLLVRIAKEDNLLKIKLKAWVIKNSHQYDPKKSDNCLPLKLKNNTESFEIGEKDKIDEELLIDYLQKIYKEATKICDCKIKNIQVFLPHELIEESLKPLDLLSIERRFSPKINPAPMGVIYEIVYRFSERIEPENSDRPIYAWKDKCNLLENQKQEIVSKIRDICDFSEMDIFELYKELIDEKIIGAKIKLLKAEDRQEVMQVLYEAGIPFALWVREHQNVNCQETLDKLCQQCTLNNLLSNIKEQRYNAWRGKEALHIGNHLSLLWDDATLVPSKSTLDYNNL
ncbi:MAG: serine protease [Crocosphaera sp.]|uniref:VMAP-C domain-containing protein n=1 Tax=Crocosphaera sp. TaxID=2729996 RepID=UPI002589F376|nr:trypsin-like peptidase domain-containing protein [Crocosphaera sp.]MCH2247184.1 serine protease [Crocosphaera sp.]